MSEKERIIHEKGGEVENEGRLRIRRGEVENSEREVEN